MGLHPKSLLPRKLACQLGPWMIIVGGRFEVGYISVQREDIIEIKAMTSLKLIAWAD